MRNYANGGGVDSNISTWAQPDSTAWEEALEADPFCKRLLDQLTEETDIVFEAASKVDKEKDPYFYRTKLPTGRLGPLMRRCFHDSEFEHLDLRYNTRKRITQVVVPSAYRQQCIVLHHDYLGHPGKSKTLQAIKASYYWPQINPATKRYCQKCNYLSLIHI